MVIRLCVHSTFSPKDLKYCHIQPLAGLLKILYLDVVDAVCCDA